MLDIEHTLKDKRCKQGNGVRSILLPLLPKGNIKDLTPCLFAGYIPVFVAVQAVADSLEDTPPAPTSLVRAIGSDPLIPSPQILHICIILNPLLNG
jgi:hypothetical protein